MDRDFGTWGVESRTRADSNYVRNCFRNRTSTREQQRHMHNWPCTIATWTCDLLTLIWKPVVASQLFDLSNELKLNSQTMFMCDSINLYDMSLSKHKRVQHLTFQLMWNWILRWDMDPVCLLSNIGKNNGNSTILSHHSWKMGAVSPP